MQFGTFTFPLRPARIRVEYKRILRETADDGPAGTGNTVQNLGAYAKVVSGDGVFAGETSTVQFAALAALFTKGAAALLVIPGVGQWQAYLAELTYQGEAGADAVRYSFRFVEAI